MARKPRIHYMGAVYHVIARGNDKQQIFFEESDLHYFTELVKEGVERFEHKIFAFCWMMNHVHLAVEVSNIPLSKVMQNLLFRYTRYINKKNNRVGHLFQGRFNAFIVDTDSYLLTLIRYIHLNPVRAGIVRNILSYKWSGHHAYIGKQSLTWLDVEYGLSFFSHNKKTAVKEYIKYINEDDAGSEVEMERGIHDSRIIGDENFVEEQTERENAYRKPSSLEDIITRTCEVLHLDKNTFIQYGGEKRYRLARQFVGYFNKYHGEETMTKVADELSVDTSTLSRTVAQLEKMRHDPDIKIWLDGVRLALLQK